MRVLTEKESSLENRCVRMALAMGVPSAKLNLRSRRFFPDRLFLVPGGRAWFCEFKRPRNARHQQMQDRTLAALRRLGYRADKVRSDELFAVLLDEYVLGRRP